MRLVRVCTLCEHPEAACHRTVPPAAARGPAADYARPMATTWEYATIPLIIHNTKAVLDQWGADGWELVQVVTGPDGNGLVAYLKRPTGEK